MSTELFVYMAEPTTGARLEEALRGLFPTETWTVAACGPDAVEATLTEDGGAPVPVEARGLGKPSTEETRAPGLSRAKQKRLRGAGWSYVVPTVDEDLELALAAALAEAGDGLVVDPREGVWWTPREARRARLAGARDRETLDGREDMPGYGWMRIEREEEEERSRGVTIEAQIANALATGDEALAAWVGERPTTHDDVSRALFAAIDADRGAALVQACTALGPHLVDFLCVAAKAPGFRTRLLFERLVDAGALSALNDAARREIVAVARQARQRDLLDELAQRGWPT